jgi:hypothetical protein
VGRKIVFAIDRHVNRLNQWCDFGSDVFVFQLCGFHLIYSHTDKVFTRNRFVGYAVVWP